jgi:AP-2 complex subunit beta-1
MFSGSTLRTCANVLCRWGQTYILEAMMNYVPQDSGEAAILAERISPRLSHSNSAVVLTCIRVILYLMNYISDQKVISSLCTKLSPPLVTLLSKGPEIQYLALRNALLILQRRPEILRNDIRVFFCKYNDPIYVKVTKLELLFMLASEKNIKEVLTELREYVSTIIPPLTVSSNISKGTPRKSTWTLSANPSAPLANSPSKSNQRQNSA